MRERHTLWELGGPPGVKDLRNIPALRLDPRKIARIPLVFRQKRPERIRILSRAIFPFGTTSKRYPKVRFHQGSRSAIR